MRVGVWVGEKGLGFGRAVERREEGKGVEGGVERWGQEKGLGEGVGNMGGGEKGG